MAHSVPDRSVSIRDFPERTPYGDDDVAEVTAAIRSQVLFGPEGTRVRALEEGFAKLYGVSHAVACTSGTAAVHTAIAALDLEPGSEIITSPVTDFGTIAGMIYQGCIPIFADWKPGAYNLDPEDVAHKITGRTAAIVPVHLFGNPCDMDAIMAIAQEHRVPVIEDCCQAYCTSYQGRYVGTIGDIGCFSMQESKHLPAGEGGLVITNSEKLAARMELFRDKGWQTRGKAGQRRYASLGLNYRMNELTAAVGLVQMRKLEQVVRARNRVGDRLTELLAGLPGINPAPVTEGGSHSYWAYPIQVTGREAEAFALAVRAEGLSCGWGYTGKPIYLCADALCEKRTFGTSGYPFTTPFCQTTVEYAPGLCPVAERELLETIILGPHEGWQEEDVEAAGRIIRKVAREQPCTA
jgi:dTDP-4-amino-4,6-dideoxygalactose transaminase